MNYQDYLPFVYEYFEGIESEAFRIRKGHIDLSYSELIDICEDLELDRERYPGKLNIKVKIKSLLDDYSIAFSPSKQDTLKITFRFLRKDFEWFFDNLRFLEEMNGGDVKGVSQEKSASDKYSLTISGNFYSRFPHLVKLFGQRKYIEILLFMKIHHPDFKDTETGT